MTDVFTHYMTIFKTVNIRNYYENQGKLKKILNKIENLSKTVKIITFGLEYSE